jgi:hypothetical protein
MGDKRVATPLCDVISGAERRVAKSAAPWVRGRTDHETPFGKGYSSCVEFVRHGESASE